MAIKNRDNCTQEGNENGVNCTQKGNENREEARKSETPRWKSAFRYLFKHHFLCTLLTFPMHGEYNTGAQEDCSKVWVTDNGVGAFT